MKKLALALILAFLLAGCSQFFPQEQVLPTPAPATITQPPPVLPSEIPSATPEAAVIFVTPTPVPVDPLWVINPVDKAILRVDPATHKIVATVQIAGRPVAVAAGEDAVWAIEGLDESRSNVLRIDPHINQVIYSIPILKGAARSLAVGNDSVWVGLAEPYQQPQPTGTPQAAQVRPGGVVRIVPFNNQISEPEYIRTGAEVVQLRLDGRILWALEKLYIYSYFDKIDLDSRLIVALGKDAPTIEYVHQFARFARNYHGLWMTSLDPGSTYIYRVSPLDGRVEVNVPVGSAPGENPVDIAADDQNLWVALANGKIARVDPNLGQVTQVMETGATTLNEIFLFGGYLWSISYRDALVYQIDPVAQGLIASIQTGSKLEPTATPTPTPLPTMVKPGAGGIWQPCETSYPTRLKVGMRIRVASYPPTPNRVRNAPNRKAEIVANIEPGTQMDVTAGPVCAEDWIWWNVYIPSLGQNGWTSEGQLSAGTIEYWLEPVP